MLLKKVDFSTQFAELGTLNRKNAAILIALYDEWIEPVSADSFGGERYITISEAYHLINKAFEGETMEYSSNLPGLEILTETWNLIEQTYVHPEEINHEEVTYAAAKAIVESATHDPYSTFFEPIEADAFDSQLSGEFVGIGLEVTIIDNNITAVSPLKNTPAEKAGMLPGDIIVAVDNVDVTEMSLFEAVQLIRGPEGTDVTLTIIRNKREQKITITRAVIVLSDVEHETIGRKAVLTISRFSNNAERDTRAALEELLAGNPNELIIDLRNNPGGFLLHQKLWQAHCKILTEQQLWVKPHLEKEVCKVFTI